MIAYDHRLQFTLEFIGQRWMGAILYALQAGPQHFNRLLEIPGISDRMLTERLRKLAEAGLVERVVDPGTPIRVVYRLTGKGLSLWPVLEAVTTWASA